jgi:chromosome segregation ATPase
MAEHMWYERAQELEAENARLRAELAAERDYVALLKRDGATLYSELEKARTELAAERDRANDAEEALTIAYMQGAADMRTERDAALANVAKLRAALEQIIADCEADYPPSHGAIKYHARAVLEETGGGDE